MSASVTITKRVEIRYHLKEEILGIYEASVEDAIALRNALNEAFPS